MSDYPQGVALGVRDELEVTVERALAAGIRRWNIILDPGIGFAKTGEENVELLRDLPLALGREGPTESPLAHFPSLVGLSRKRFLGTLTGREDAMERDWATAAGVSVCVEKGADIIRCHEGRMGDVVKVADAVYRGRK